MSKLEWKRYSQDDLQPYWMELSARRGIFKSDRTVRWFTADIVADAQVVADGQRKPWRLHTSLGSDRVTNKKYETLEKAMQAAQKTLDRELDSVRKEEAKRQSKTDKVMAADIARHMRAEGILAEMKTGVDALLAGQNERTKTANDPDAGAGDAGLPHSRNEHLDLARQVLEIPEGRRDGPEAVEKALEERWGIGREEWVDLIDTLIHWTRPFQDTQYNWTVYAFGTAEPETPGEWTPIITHIPPLQGEQPK